MCFWHIRLKGVWEQVWPSTQSRRWNWHQTPQAEPSAYAAAITRRTHCTVQRTEEQSQEQQQEDASMHNLDKR